MANSMFSTLLGMLDKRSLGSIGGALGESEQSVSRGMESSIAAVLGALASKSEDPGALSKTLDLVPGTLGEVTGSQIASSVANPDSPLLLAGKRLMSGLFGNSESVVTSALSAHSGLRPGVTSSLMAMAAPMVMSFIGRRVRDEGTTMSGLGSLLQRESATFRTALPASLCDLFWPKASVASTASPVVAQTVERERERSSTRWLPLLALLALIPAFFWILNHGRRPAMPVAPVPTGTANRTAAPVPKLACTLPANVNLTGDEALLLAFVQNPDAKPSANSWFTFDRLSFDTGSAKLRPESQAQLNNIAMVLTNCPTVHLKIAGYTDNVGSAESNLRLSRNRANSVMAELVSKGVPRDCLTAEGYGLEYPVADNTSEEGKARNRRVAMLVTQK